MIWKIEKRNINDLKSYEKNPRKFTKKGLADLKESIKNCGDANIITINADNTVLGGHARLKVMKQLGFKEVDVKVPDRLLNDGEVKERKLVEIDYYDILYSNGMIGLSIQFLPLVISTIYILVK